MMSQEEMSQIVGLVGAITIHRRLSKAELDEIRLALDREYGPRAKKSFINVLPHNQ